MFVYVCMYVSVRLSVRVRAHVCARVFMHLGTHCKYFAKVSYYVARKVCFVNISKVMRCYSSLSCTVRDTGGPTAVHMCINYRTRKSRH